MVTRPELIEICKELDIVYEDTSREDMVESIKKEADRRYSKKRYPISPHILSPLLKKFLLNEYDYILRDKSGKRQKEIDND